MHDEFFIDDGYDQDGHIAAVEGVHGPVDFTFRPMIQADRQAHYELVVKKKLPVDKAMERTVAKHIRSWSLKREPTPENLGRLRAPLLEKLHAIISGEAASDGAGEDALTASEQDEEDAKN